MSKTYETITERVLELLEAGTVPWHQPWASSEMRPRNLRGNVYRGVNAFMTGCQGYSDPRWLTYKQCEAAGGQVRKGEKSTPVMFWKFIEKPGDADEAEAGEKTRGRRMFAKGYRVFNVEQCDGLELEPIIRPAPRAVSPIQECERIVAGMPNRPDVVHAGGRAFYRPSTDTVTFPPMSSFESGPAYYGTAFHELAHSTGHASRLNRKGLEEAAGFGSATYSREELVAEMTAAFLAGEAGISAVTVEQTAAYIDGWRRALRADPSCVVMAGAQAQKAADYILDIHFDEKEG